jgi:ABC-2 type transport system permease protein
MRMITTVDPFTRAVHGFKELILKNTSLPAVAPDTAFLMGFAAVAPLAATLLFRRTL